METESLNLDHLREWIGKTESQTDRITSVPIAALSATLDREILIRARETTCRPFGTGYTSCQCIANRNWARTGIRNAGASFRPSHCRDGCLQAGVCNFFGRCVQEKRCAGYPGLLT